MVAGNRSCVVYIVTHGPYREPRLADLQYLRISRYLNLLRQTSGRVYEEKGVFVDLNFPRGSTGESIPNLFRLIDFAKEGGIDLVFVDIEIGRSFSPYEMMPIFNTLKHEGLEVINVFSSPDPTASEATEGVARLQRRAPSDAEEMIALFPALAARIAEEIIGDDNPQYEPLLRDIQALGMESPYQQGGIPTVSKRKP